jgi:hypothetical protein
METYIVRIHRRQAEGKSLLPTGIVENAKSGKMAKFADSSGLLKILKIEKIGTCDNYMETL